MYVFVVNCVRVWSIKILSYHIISFQVEQDKQKIEPTWKWHKADWTGFNLALQYNPLSIPPTVTQRTCEKLLEELNKESEKPFTASRAKSHRGLMV